MSYERRPGQSPMADIALAFANAIHHATGLELVGSMRNCRIYCVLACTVAAGINL
jgi:hypothetical protein